MGLFDRLLGGKRADAKRTDAALAPAPAAAAAPRIAVRLRPFVPIPAERAPRSWLGGSPRVPDPFEWPHGDGKPFHFVAQIDCSELPAGLWLGAGPRRGWLVFFVGTRGGYMASEVLHVASLGPERAAPAPWDPEWLRLYPFRDAPEDWRHEPPRWPVEVLARPDGEADPEAADAAAEAGQLDEVDLARAEYQPHDWRTLRALLHVMRGRVASRRESLAKSVHLLARPDAAPSPELDAKIADGRALLARVEAVEAATADLATTVAEAEARGAPYAWDDWRPRVDALLAESAGCHAFDARHAFRAWNALRSTLAARAYAANPAAPALPAPVLGYFLEQWRKEASRRMAGMGGTTRGYTDVADPEDDGTQLLLELPDSALFGWSWGDSDSLVVVTPLDALRRGDFGAVVTDVTNGGR